MPLIPKLQGVTYAGSGPQPYPTSPGPGGSEYGGEWEAPMTTGGPVVSGIQEYLRKLQSQGLPPTPQNVNRIREATSNGVTLPRPPIPPTEGATSAPPSRSIAPNAASDSATLASGDVRVGMPQVETPAILPDAMGMIPDSAVPAAGLAAGALGAGGLGALILKLLGGNVPAITPTGATSLPPTEMSPRLGGPAANPALNAPDPRLALPPAEVSPRIGGPAIPAQVEGARAGTPQLAAPGERPPIPLGAVPTGEPTIPLPGPGTVPRATPETTPKGPGFDPEVGKAIDKAVEEPPTTRAKPSQRGAPGKTARGKLKVRI
jgi:hypothetical protein